jgi:hypothetical protein
MSMTQPAPAQPAVLDRTRKAWPGLASRTPGAVVTLTGALVALVLYAAFAGGAANLAGQARIQVCVAIIAMVCAGSVLWTGTLRFAAPRRAVAGLALLAAFTAWSAISLAWSVSPDSTWTEFNRALTYVIVLGLAITAGASGPRSLELLARGFLLAVVLVALYGIGQKLLPGVHIAGLINLNQPQSLPRLEAPLGYWNALAVFLSMGVPVALAFAVDTARPSRLRLWALLALHVLLLTTVLTYSRGGLLALLVGGGAGIALSGARLRSLLWLAAASVAVLPPLLTAILTPALTGVGVALGAREHAGLALTAVLLASLFAARWIGKRLLAAEQRVTIGPERRGTIGRLLAALTAGVLVVALAAVALSPRGLTGTVSHAWDSFTATHGTSTYGPDRLLSVDSENRWVWWREAVGAFSDRPVTGWGAGSFAVVQPLYSDGALPVKQPHSVILQFLAETGLVGTALAVMAFGLLLAAALAAVRRAPAATRLLPAAMFAIAATYSLHTFYDWDWDIPGVTLPALICLGVLIGSGRARAPGATTTSGSGGALRIVTLAVAALVCCVVAISGVLPSLAAADANSAQLLAASSSSPADLLTADSRAVLATRLNPLSDAGLLVEAAIAIREHNLPGARSDLLAGIRRDPEDAIAWLRLVSVESNLRDSAGALAASQRVLELSPTRFGRLLVRQALFRISSPASSATAIRTPLPTH